MNTCVGCLVDSSFLSIVGQFSDPKLSKHKNANTIGGRYVYAQDLRAIQSCSHHETFRVPRGIVSPLSDALPTWMAMLSSHPDGDFRNYIITGLTEGFRIGFNYSNHFCQSNSSNHPSVANNPEVIQEYLADECTHKQLIGPLHSLLYPHVITSPFGVIPKPDKPGKWRLILDLSSPDGASVNDGISSTYSSLSYVTVDEIVEEVLKIGQGCYLAKIDIKSAFRLIPVHPDDRHLLGMRWKGAVYIDCVLPFGLRSAPKIFNAVADALQWILISRDIQDVYHYLDDYLCIIPPGRLGGQHDKPLQRIIQICRELGVPLALEKVEGPSTCLTFLGIEIDTMSLQIHLPPRKLQKVKNVVSYWLQQRKACKKRDLQSLAGLLQHACKVVRPGRIFLRHIIETMESARHADHWVRLNSSFRSDVIWWDSFLTDWNGVSMLWSRQAAAPAFVVTSDASGSWGCGALQGSHWFQIPWNQDFVAEPIHVKELLPVVVAAFLWGKNWCSCIVEFVCDNMAVVEVLNRGYSRDKSIMRLLRSLFFVAAKFNFWFTASHIPGSLNTAADAISRNKLDDLHIVAPNLSRFPSLIPQEILQTLSSTHEWASRDWAKQFSAYLTTQ